MQRWAFDGEFLGVPGALVPRGRSILYCRIPVRFRFVQMRVDVCALTHPIERLWWESVVKIYKRTVVLYITVYIY